MPTLWPLLDGPTIYLRFPTNVEAERITKWLNDPATAQFLNAEDPIRLHLLPQELRLRRIMSALGTARVVGQSHTVLKDRTRPTAIHLDYTHRTKPDAIVFAILQQESDVLVGVIVLNVSILHQVGTIRTVVAPYMRRSHFGREAKALILDFAFRDLQLVKVFSEMLGDNIANRKVNDALGFVLEGTLRNHVMVLGKRRDLLCMGILREEWTIGKWLSDISPKRLP